MKNTIAEPSFTYGLNIFFNPNAIALPSADDAPSAARPVVHAGAGATILSFDEALREEKYEVMLQDYFSRPAQDRVDAWRDAAKNGLLIHVPNGVELDRPITIDIALAEARRVDHLLIVAGPRSAVTVVERLTSAPGTRAIRASRTEIVARPGAKVTHITVQNFAQDVTDFSEKRARVERDASLAWIECVFGGSYSRSNSRVELAEEGAALKSATLFFGAASQRFDFSQNVRHLASRTRSDMRTRGALAGSAKTIYRGLVRIDAGTEGCDGYQKEDTLLLSDAAEIDAVPNLEINANDVRCGHGAATGRIDREKLFYLMSRGLDETAAKKFLVEGFFAPIVAGMRDAGLEDMVTCLVAERAETYV